MTTRYELLNDNVIIYCSKINSTFSLFLNHYFYSNDYNIFQIEFNDNTFWFSKRDLLVHV